MADVVDVVERAVGVLGFQARVAFVAGVEGAQAAVVGLFVVVVGLKEGVVVEEVREPVAVVVARVDLDALAVGGVFVRAQD
jgi:hypothetical protein